LVVVISKRWVNLSQRPKMTAKHVEIEVKNIDHLGLVAGIIDEMGLVDIINELVGIERGEIVSAGVVVKGIILNGLGFVSRPLYLFPQFFEDKATEHLLGKGIKPEHLNDDKIGRVMDKLYVKGTRNIFMSIALAAVKKYGIETKNLHLDSTSFCLEGKYECQDNDWSINIAEKGSINQEQYQGKQPLKVGWGYSRDRRPDLKQFIVDLVVSGDSNIPLGKLTNSPTLRWIFQGFQGIHLVILQGIKQIVNLTDERWWTLSFFPESVQNYYLLSG